MSVPFMQLYVADYLGDTRHLTTEQHGAYLLLLMTMWRSGGRLPSDPKKLARIACCTGSRWSRISDEVMAFFDVDGDEITNPRLALELEKASEKSIKRAAAGSLGGKANSLKYNKPGQANAKPSSGHSSEPESDKESPLPPKGEKKKAPRGRVSIPDGFPDTEALKVARDMVVAAGVAIHVRTEADKMRDWAIGKGEKKADWMAAWRNWIRMACERAPALGLVQREVQTEHDPWPMRVRAWVNDTGWNHVDWGPEPFEPGCRVPPHHLPPRAAE